MGEQIPDHDFVPGVGRGQHCLRCGFFYATTFHTPGTVSYGNILPLRRQR